MQSQGLERGEAGPLGRTGWAWTVGLLEQSFVAEDRAADVATVGSFSFFFFFF